MNEILKAPTQPEVVSPEEEALYKRFNGLATKIDTIITRELAAGRGRSVDRTRRARFEIDGGTEDPVTKLGHVVTPGKLGVLIEDMTYTAGKHGPDSKTVFIVEINDDRNPMRTRKDTLTLTVFNDSRPPSGSYLIFDRGDVTPSTNLRAEAGDLLARFENAVDRLPAPPPAPKKSARRRNQ